MQTTATNDRCFPVASSQICSLYASYAFDGDTVNTILNIFPYKMPASLLNRVQNAKDLDTTLNFTLNSLESVSAWNCKETPTKLRYHSSILCALIASNSNCPPNENQNRTDLCQYVRDSYLESFLNLVSSKNCSLIEPIKYEQVKNKLSQLSVSNDAQNCSLGVPQDSTTCGFGNMADMTLYCSSRNDFCCSAGERVIPLQPVVSHSSLSVAAIIGIALGGALLVILFLLLAWYKTRHLAASGKKNLQDTPAKSLDTKSPAPSLVTIPLDNSSSHPSHSTVNLGHENQASQTDTSGLTPTCADSSFSSFASLRKQDAVITRRDARMIADIFRATLTRAVTHKSTLSQESQSSLNSN